MLFAPALTDRVILPPARGNRYFFNRIGWKVPLADDRYRPRVCKNIPVNPCYDFRESHRKGRP